MPASSIAASRQANASAAVLCPAGCLPLPSIAASGQANARTWLFYSLGATTSLHRCSLMEKNTERAETHVKRWETWSLRLEGIVIEHAGHKTAALALACLDAAIEDAGIVFATDLLALH